MRTILLGAICASLVCGQTAEELVRRNLDAKGGIEKIKAIKTLRMSGKVQQGSFTADIGEDAMAPNLLRQNFTVQGMTAVQAYDGKIGWKISPFEGRKDAQLVGEEELRDLIEDADIYGPLVDYQARGTKVEYIGHDTVDGDDVYRLKVTLKNGDLYYYYLDPETFLEIRIESVRYIRGSVQEDFREPGSYKEAGGIYFPFSYETGSKQNPLNTTKLTVDKIEVNVPLEKSHFQMPENKGGK